MKSLLSSLASLLTIIAVTSEAAAEGIVRDAAGTYIGRLVAIENYKITVETSTGYIAVISNAGGVYSLSDPGSIKYLDPQCSGQEYALRPNILPSVFRAWSDQENRYVAVFTPRLAEPVYLAVGDQFYEWQSSGFPAQIECVGVTISPNWELTFLVPIERNDPAETGISNTPYIPPFRFHSGHVFENGFEQYVSTAG